MKIDNLAAYNFLAPEPIKAELEKAERLLLLHGMVPTQEALDAGKLTSLFGCYKGEIRRSVSTKLIRSFRFTYSHAQQYICFMHTVENSA